MATVMKKTIMGEMTYKEYGELIEALSKKTLLDAKEAAVYFDIGINRVRRLGQAADCDFKVDVSKKSNRPKYMFDREKMTAYLRNM